MQHLPGCNGFNKDWNHSKEDERGYPSWEDEKDFPFHSSQTNKNYILPLSLTNLQGLSIKAAGGKAVHSDGKI